MRNILFLLIFMGASFKINSAQYVSMDATEVISVQLSSSNHNRIGIVGDRIKKAFFKSTNITVDVEESTGQLFIQSIKQDCPPTTLSVITTSGIVQELELCFSECPSSIVLLQSDLECAETSNKYTCPDVVDSAGITQFVESFLKGSIPEGYTSVEDEEGSSTIHNCIKLQRVSRLISNQQIIFVYRMQNTSSKPKNVQECQVNVLDGDWVFIDRYKLNPHECGLVLIGCVR